jgi:hypothetical protein
MANAKAAVRVKPLSGWAKKALTDMAVFFRHTNWLELWERWNTEIIPDGTFAHKTVKIFAHKIAKSQQQKEFLNWYLGPKIENDSRNQDYPFVQGPVDWQQKRDNGCWWSDEAMRTMNKAITVHSNALDALRHSGNQVVLHSFTSIKVLFQKLDEAFNGQFFAEGLTFEQNMHRANAYLSLRTKLVGLMERTQAAYARAHGINFDDMNGFAQIVAASALVAEKVSGSKQNRFDQVLAQLHTVALEKSSKMGLPVPDEINDKIIDIVPITPNKGGVQ